MSKFRDLTDQRFSNLLVLHRSERKLGANVHWVCLCDCGRKLIVRADNLTCGRTSRCSMCRGGSGVASIFVWGDDFYGL